MNIRERVLRKRSDYVKSHDDFPNQLFLNTPDYLDLCEYCRQFNKDADSFVGVKFANMTVHFVDSLETSYVAGKAESLNENSTHYQLRR